MLSKDIVVKAFNAAGCYDSSIIEEFIVVQPELSIDNERRLAMFIAQCSHESGGFKYRQEGLYYTTPERICAVWPSRFPNVESAKPYVKNSRALANKVYGDRMGNRPGTNDGYDFAGKGWIQLTGRDNYTVASKAMGVDLINHPDMATETDIGFQIADWFFNTRKMSGVSAYQYSDSGDVTTVTKIINGGYNGLEHRTELYIDICIALKLEIVKQAPVGVFKLGDRGDDIKVIQKELVDKGYDTNGVDGIFGNGMLKAVTSFQKESGLVADGIVGSGTLSVLFS